MTRNWAGTYSYTAPRIETPGTVDALRALVEAPGRVRALGTRHSFTDLPDTGGTLIDVTALPAESVLDEEQRTVTVAAGIRYGVLAAWLDERGWALSNMGSLPHINVGGATATGTHGSGDAQRSLAANVRMLRYVGADAEVREVRRGDPDFDALVVGLGAYGIVVALTLDVVPAFRMRQDVYTGVTWEAALGDLTAVTGAGYSVSVFSRWDDETIGDIWVKTRLDRDDDAVPVALLDGRQDAAAEPLGGLADVTELGGVPGPWMLRLPHFRLDGTPSFGDEIQSEYFVPRAHAAAALQALRPLAARIQPLLFITELRTVAADDLWLSPASGQDVMAIHFTWGNHPRAVRALLVDIEAALEPFAARPHWGKLHLMERDAIARTHARLDEARAVFERLDPDGRFSNAHLERVGVRERRG